jgi:hypothetical protein
MAVPCSVTILPGSGGDGGGYGALVLSLNGIAGVVSGGDGREDCGCGAGGEEADEGTLTGDRSLMLRRTELL